MRKVMEEKERKERWFIPILFGTIRRGGEEK